MTRPNIFRLHVFCLYALIALPFWAGPLAAQVQSESYATLAREMDGRIDFETLPQRPEPGFNLDAPMRVRGAWLGERLTGQTVTGAPHDQITGAPNFPLTITAGAPGRNLSVALHRGFGSNALFALGPGGFPALDARGEGAVAVVFDRDQAAFGLRIHADYPDPLARHPPPGTVRLQLFARTGALIGEVEIRLTQGIIEMGLRRDGNIPDIAAFIVTNTDPGGIAIDDILFQLTALIG